MVFWVETREEEKAARCREFATDQLAAALAFMESLRKARRDGEVISHVTMSSEHPDSVGPPGVDETGADYNWKKRR